MHIRRLDPAENPQDLEAVVPAFNRWREDFLPGLPGFGKARLRHWCMSGYQQQVMVFGAFADESATVAEAVAVYGYELTKNLDLAWTQINLGAEVRPRGAEAALFDAVARQTAELGRKRLAIGMPEPQGPPAFAARHGDGKLTDTAIMSTLDLSRIDRARYEAWAEPSAKNGEYTLVGWTGRTPDELAESFCTAMDAMADQPLGTFEYEFAEYDLDRLRFREEQIEKVGIRRYTQVALDKDGNVAGFNILAAHPDEPELIDIWDTGVTRDHRGHGLGLRLKAAATLWVLEDRPSTRLVATFNNDENQWMLGVNWAMGYQPLVKFPGYEFAIAD